MTRYGYGRVSTAGQTVETQREELLRLGIEPERIYTEQRSGVKDRPMLRQLLSILQRGDELVVVKLDRLGRSARDLHAIAEELQKKGVTLTFDKNTYNPADPMGQAIFGFFAVFAELERNLIAQRTKERLASIKAAGGSIGRRKAVTPEREQLILEFIDRYPMSEVETLTGVSRSSLYRIKRQAEGAREEDADPSITRARLDQQVADRKSREKRLAKDRKRWEAVSTKDND